jgi:hypothetical protein
MPVVLRVYPNGRRVSVVVDHWDLPQYLRVSAMSRPECAHRVDGEWRNTGRVDASTLRQVEQEEK